jgi:hypothetical protein
LLLTGPRTTAIAELIKSATEPAKAQRRSLEFQKFHHQSHHQLRHQLPHQLLDRFQPTGNTARLRRISLERMAGAILRDRQTRIVASANQFHLVKSQFRILPEFLPADDEISRRVDDTAASARPVTSRARIFA